MRRILVFVAMFSVSGLAVAGPCPQGANVRLGDRTNPGQDANTQLLDRAGASANSQTGRGTAGGATLRNHFPH